MWNMVVATGSALAGRLMLGFVEACSAHPVLVVGFFCLMLGLVLALWAEMLQERPDPLRTDGRRGTEDPVRSRP